MKALAPTLLAGLIFATTAAEAQERGSGTITFVSPATPGKGSSVGPPSTRSRVPAGSAQRRASLWPHVVATARAHGLDPELIDLVIRMESGYNPFAVSPKGARGLMQLLPSTARAYGVSDIFDAHDNISGGVRYLRDLMGRFGKDVRLVLAAYNAGPETVERYGGVPPYRETRNYVDAIMATYDGIGLARVTGGFGRPVEPAPPVLVEEMAGRKVASNVPGRGEAQIERRLRLR